MISCSAPDLVVSDAIGKIAKHTMLDLYLETMPKTVLHSVNLEEGFNIKADGV